MMEKHDCSLMLSICRKCRNGRDASFYWSIQSEASIECATHVGRIKCLIQCLAKTLEQQFEILFAIA